MEKNLNPLQRRKSNISELTNTFFINSYLEEVKKRSPGSFINNRAIIRNLTKEIPKDFVEFTMMDIHDYLVNKIDIQEIKKNSKNSKRYSLMAFFNYIQKTLMAYNIEYQNPVPSKKLYKFSTNLDDIEYLSDERLKVLTLTQIKNIVRTAHNIFSYRDSTLINIAIFCGCRISEIRTIMRKHLDLNNYSFQTGFVLGARKTTLHTGKGLLFFYPPEFNKYLQKYIDSCKKCETWLFPGYKGEPLSRARTQNIITKLRKMMGFHFTWHYFRRTIVSERMKIGCPKWISEGLTNHAPSDVQAKSYVKLSLKEKRTLYNKWNPYKKLLNNLD